jgi:hypothetical protein
MRVNDTVRVTELSRREFIADKASKSMRRANARGHISATLGKREELYLVIHEGESVPAVYLREELELEPNAYWKITYSCSGYWYFAEAATYRHVEKLRNELGDSAKSVMIEGPFYSDKELTEGLLPSRTLFDHLKEKD